MLRNTHKKSLENLTQFRVERPVTVAGIFKVDRSNVPTRIVHDVQDVSCKKVRKTNGVKFRHKQNSAISSVFFANCRPNSTNSYIPSSSSSSIPPQLHRAVMRRPSSFNKGCQMQPAQSILATPG